MASRRLGVRSRRANGIDHRRGQVSSSGVRVRQRPSRQQAGWRLVCRREHQGAADRCAVTDQLLQNLAPCAATATFCRFPHWTCKNAGSRGMMSRWFLCIRPMRSVRFKGTIWIRSGPRRGIANPDDERRLNEKRRCRDLPVDIRPVGVGESRRPGRVAVLPHLFAVRSFHGDA